MASIGLAYCCSDPCADLARLAVGVDGRGLDDCPCVTGRLGAGPSVRHSRAVLISTLEF